MTTFICHICNEVIKTYVSVWEDKINYFWDDDLYNGYPICKDCATLVKGNPHLNWDWKPKQNIIKIGLEKWL